MLGREVATLVNETKQPGSYTVPWNAQGMSSGVYFYELRTKEYIMSKRMLVLK